MEASLLVISSIQAAGTVPGRTSLQKICYFANHRLRGGVFFFPHYFGPYSPDISRAATELVSSQLIQDQIDSGSLSHPWLTNRGRMITEWERHNLSISADGRRYLKSIKDDRRAGIQRIHEVVSVLQEATELDPTALSLAAKLHYVVKNDGASTWRQVKARTRAHGWALSDEDLRAGLRTLSRIRFRVALR